jgi:hypothetical protein
MEYYIYNTSSQCLFVEAFIKLVKHEFIIAYDDNNASNDIIKHGETIILESSFNKRKTDLTIERLEAYYSEHLKTKISKEKCSHHSKYISSMKVETNLSDNHRYETITSLKILSKFLNNKSFKIITREDMYNKKNSSETYCSVIVY